MDAEVSMNVAHTDNRPNVDVNQVLHLIETLYHSNNPADQTEANKRLEELQASQDAWQISWLLLDSNKSVSGEAQFIAAQMLLMKINQSWNQQDDEWLEHQLRPRICETLVKYASSPDAGKLVVDRLALALANFALHSIPTFWPDAIKDILQTFTPQNLPVTIPAERVCDILLKILMYIPEEYSTIVPQQEHRAKLNSQIMESGHLVFRFLHSLLKVPPNNDMTSECRQNVLKCLTSWTLHSRISLLEIDDGKTLLNHLLELISDEELCCPACSALAAALGGQSSDNLCYSIIEFIPKIARLKPIIDKYRMDDEMECVIKIYSLVINFSENHSRIFLKVVLNDGIELDDSSRASTKQAISTILAMILESTSAPGIYGVDEKFSDISFPFWFTFFESFYYYQESYNDIICETFNPLVDSLVRTLIEKSQYPSTSTYYQVWNDDQRESYRCYRQDLGDNISLIAHFPRARERILAQLHDKLARELSDLLASKAPPGGERPWQRLETTVFALKSISESVPYDESRHVSKIFNILTQIPFNETHSLLYCTVAEMISSYSDWLYAHSPQLSDAYNILFLGVLSTDSHVKLMSTLSLKDITSECQSVLRPYATNIVKCCTEAVMRPDSNLNTSEKSRLMHTIGTSLAVSSNDTVITTMNSLTVPLICELGAKAQIEPNVEPTVKSFIIGHLTMLNSLIESLYVKNYNGNDYEDGDENDARAFDPSRYEPVEDVDIIKPTLDSLKQLIPIFNVIGSKYNCDEEIMDLITNTVKRSSKSLGVEIKPVLNDMLMLIVNTYDPLSYSNIIEGSLPLFSLFKSDITMRETFRDAFALISDKTLKICIGNPLRQLSLTIENYFRFATLICRKFPSFLTDQVTPINIEYIYKLAIASLELPERRTLGEVCNFLCILRQASLGIDHLEGIFTSGLDVMISNIFNILGGLYSTPRNANDHVTDLLFAVIDSQHTRDLLRQIVEKDNFPTSFVSKDQKARFVSGIIHEKHKRKFKDKCTEFVLLARNLTHSSW